ncbi:MAG: Gfo/Idh/MocA family oxidoreductase [Candidatus Paceibacterota bacterium]
MNLKVGIIGAGFNANFHRLALQSVRGAEITGVFAVAGAEAFAAEVESNGLGECSVCESVSELCQISDIVCMFMPNFARVETMEEITQAVQKGENLKGVICEKPLGSNMKEARRLVELANSVGLNTAYFENQIHMPAIHSALTQLTPTQKKMGPVTLTRSAEEHGGPHEGWFWDPTRQGGGVLCDMGCHSIAVGWYCLNPIGKSPTFMRPKSVNCSLGLLKWGLPYWREKLLKDRGVDYAKTPAEDYCSGTIVFENPETGQIAQAQFTDSWMFEKQGLRLLMEAMGPGYALEVNSLISPLSIFIGDAAAEATANAEAALEKATASRGLLAVQPNEPDLYGYVSEWRNALSAFSEGKNAFLDWEYGLEITRLVMASYVSAECGKVINLADPLVLQVLENFVPLIQQGRGNELFHVA